MAKRGSLFGAITVLLVAASVGLWGGPAASAASKKAASKKAGAHSREADVSRKAWFAAAPPCAAADCSALPPTSPYPEDTLHVAINGGQETARTYLAFDFKLPDDTEPVGGTLELPIDADPAHGSLLPENAAVVACVTTREFKDERGSLAAPPEADCDVRRAALYDEKKAVFTVDLDRFVEDWAAEALTGGTYKVALALVPSPSAVKGGDTWHVVFPAADREKSKARQKPKKDAAPTITATIEFAPVTEDDAFGSDLFGSGSDAGVPPAGSSSGTDFGAGSGSGSSFDSGAPAGDSGDAGNDSGVGSFGSAAAATDAAAGEDAGPPAQLAAPPSSLAGFAGPGFAYPIMWAFPLALLVGLAALGRALTKDLYRRGL